MIQPGIIMIPIDIRIKSCQCHSLRCRIIWLAISSTHWVVLRSSIVWPVEHMFWHLVILMLEWPQLSQNDVLYDQVRGLGSDSVEVSSLHNNIRHTRPDNYLILFITEMWEKKPGDSIQRHHYIHTLDWTKQSLSRWIFSQIKRIMIH